MMSGQSQFRERVGEIVVSFGCHCGNERGEEGLGDLYGCR